jgi:hypothetical protein
MEAAQAAAAAARSSNKPRVAVNLTKRESQLDFTVKKPFDEMSVADKALFCARWIRPLVPTAPRGSGCGPLRTDPASRLDLQLRWRLGGG